MRENAAHAARVVEQVAVSLDRLAKPDPVDSRDERLQLCAPDFQRQPAPVLTSELQKIESDERRLSRPSVASQRSEVAMAVAKVWSVGLAPRGSAFAERSRI
jgi:hypothetical protein